MKCKGLDGDVDLENGCEEKTNIFPYIWKYTVGDFVEFELSKS